MKDLIRNKFTVKMPEEVRPLHGKEITCIIYRL